MWVQQATPALVQEREREMERESVTYPQAWRVRVCSHNRKSIARHKLPTNRKSNNGWEVVNHKILYERRRGRFRLRINLLNSEPLLDPWRHHHYLSSFVNFPAVSLTQLLEACLLQMFLALLDHYTVRVTTQMTVLSTHLICAYIRTHTHAHTCIHTHTHTHTHNTPWYGEGPLFTKRTKSSAAALWRSKVQCYVKGDPRTSTDTGKVGRY